MLVGGLVVSSISSAYAASARDAVFFPAVFDELIYEPNRDACHLATRRIGDVMVNVRTGRAYVRAPREAGSARAGGSRSNIHRMTSGLERTLLERCNLVRTVYFDEEHAARQQRVGRYRNRILDELTPDDAALQGRQDDPQADRPAPQIAVVDGMEPLISATSPERPKLSWGDLGFEHRSTAPRVPRLIEAPAGLVRERRSRLHQAIEAALAGSSSLEAAKQRIEAARQAVFTKSREEKPFLVTLLADLGIEEDDSDEPILRATASSGLSVTVPLYDGGLTSARTRLERHGLTFRHLDLEQNQARIAASIRTIYWNAILLGIERRQLAAWRAPVSDWFKKADILLKERLATENEVLALSNARETIEARLRTIDLELDTYDAAWFALTNGRLSDALPAASDAWPPLPTIPASTVRLAGHIERTTAVRRADASIAEARDRVMEQKLALSGRLNFEGRAEMDVRSDQEVFVGVRYRLPLYDNGIATSRERELSFELAAASLERTAVLDATRARLDALMLELSSQKLAVDAAVSNLATARKNFEDSAKLFLELPDRLQGLTAGLRGYVAAITADAAARRSFFILYDRLLLTLDIVDSEIAT